MLVCHNVLKCHPFLNRQKKYRKAEYVQRRVRFVNVQNVFHCASIKCCLQSKVVFRQK